MSDALLRFARTGDPSGGGIGQWPRYDLSSRATMIFDAQNRVENDPRKVEREMFGKAPYIQPGTYEAPKTGHEGAAFLRKTNALTATSGSNPVTRRGA